MCVTRILAFYSIAVAMLFVSDDTHASMSKAELFSQHSPKSSAEIEYPYVDLILEISVFDLGPSNRKLADRPLGNTGTRFKKRVNRLTALEGNRIRFENFSKQSYRESLDDIVTTLTGLPEQVSLMNLSKNEQLAFWLNLYNVTLLREMAYRQSEERIQFEFANEKDSTLFNRAVVNVEGHALSLNDIKYDIILNNFKDNENVIYGFFTGVVGGPSLQPKAFTGNNVVTELKRSAKDFINSNRGTYYNGRLSVLYDRYQDFFSGDDKASAIQSHILGFIYDDMRESIAEVEASQLEMDIVDFSKASIFDKRVYGAGNSIARTDGSLKRGEDSRALLRELVRKRNANRAVITVKDLSESEALSKEK